ncbi:hypothetical protein TWF281_009849 [Arthrobotrys megalospora]
MMFAFLQLFLVATFLHLCAAAPVVVNPGAVNKLSLKKPLNGANGAVPESGVLVDNLTIDAGDTAFRILHNPTNAGIVTNKGLEEVNDITNEALTYTIHVANDPTNIGNI